MPLGLFDQPEPPESLRRHFAAADQPIEHWPAERLRAYQTEAVAAQLAHVHANNKFYRGKFDRAGVKPADFRTLDDLRRFPFTTKDEILEGPWTLLSVPKKDVHLAHTSTGTTRGDRWTYIFYSAEDMTIRDFAPYPRLLMPVGEEDVVVNALPYEMSSAGQSFQRSLQGVAGALVVPVGKGGFYADPYKTARVMADLGATVLITTPPYALLLSEIAAQLGLSIGLRFMWLTGEGCSPAYRRRLEEAWKCPGLVFYGSLECGSIGIECAAQSGNHVCEGHMVVEIIDPKTGEALPPGQVGEVVCTLLQRKASPLVRYRTQDLALLDVAPCSCGVRFPRLHIRGRIVDQVGPAEGGGASISPYLIEEVLYAQPEMGGNYQAYTAENRLLVEAEWRGGEGEQDAVRQRILGLLRQRGLEAELNWVGHIPRTGGKTRRIRPVAEREQVMASASLLRKV